MYAGMENVVEVDEVVYTVEDAVNDMGFGAFQVLVTFFSGFIWVRVPPKSFRALTTERDGTEAGRPFVFSLCLLLKGRKRAGE